MFDAAQSRIVTFPWGIIPPEVCCSCRATNGTATLNDDLLLFHNACHVSSNPCRMIPFIWHGYTNTLTQTHTSIVRPRPAVQQWPVTLMQATGSHTISYTLQGRGSSDTSPISFLCRFVVEEHSVVFSSLAFRCRNPFCLLFCHRKISANSAINLIVLVFPSREILFYNNITQNLAQTEKERTKIADKYIIQYVPIYHAACTVVPWLSVESIINGRQIGCRNSVHTTICTLLVRTQLWNRSFENS